MRFFTSEDGVKEYTRWSRFNRLESNIMLVRRKAIWANRNPDLAEKQYRAKVEENERLRNMKSR